MCLFAKSSLGCSSVPFQKLATACKFFLSIKQSGNHSKFVNDQDVHDVLLYLVKQTNH